MAKYSIIIKLTAGLLTIGSLGPVAAAPAAGYDAAAIASQRLGTAQAGEADSRAGLLRLAKAVPERDARLVLTPGRPAAGDAEARAGQAKVSRGSSMRDGAIVMAPAGWREYCALNPRDVSCRAA